MILKSSRLQNVLGKRLGGPSLSQLMGSNVCRAAPGSAGSAKHFLIESFLFICDQRRPAKMKSGMSASWGNCLNSGEVWQPKSGKIQGELSDTLNSRVSQTGEIYQGLYFPKSYLCFDYRETEHWVLH